jgi:hypothetical protein
MTYSIDLSDRGAFMTGAPSNLGAKFARSWVGVAGQMLCEDPRHVINRTLISADDGFGV